MQLPEGTVASNRRISAAGLLLTVLSLVLIAPVSAAEPRRAAALVIDANTGAELHAQAADAPRYPASLTKMMTLYIVFEHIEQGALSYNTRIKVSQEAAMAAPSRLELEPGEEIAVIDAVKALVTKSANDVAVALAEHIGGTESDFARMMTAKARQLGMASTTFRNASGLPDPGQTTTARDMLKLALHLQDDFPKHYPLFSTRVFTYNGDTYRNHNTLLARLPGTDGIKTGYTRASGFNVVTSVRRDGKHVVGVVFGGASAAKRNAEMRQLLTRALARASTRKTRKPTLVAQLRPATRPAKKVAEAKTTGTNTVAAASPAASPAPGPLAAPARQPQPEERPETGAVVPPAIHITKVRRVMVAPHMGRRPAEPDETTEEAPANAPAPLPPLPTLTAAAATAPAPAPAVTRSLGAGVRPPSTLDEQMRALIAASGTDPYSAPSHEPALIAASRPGPIGRPPSTLAEQARYLAPEPPAPDPRVHSGSVAASGSARFHIQVGAYGSAEDAARQIAAVRQHAGPVLEGRAPMTLPVRKGERQLYRARFAGFDANGAASACQELRRRQIECFVMKAE